MSNSEGIESLSDEVSFRRRKASSSASRGPVVSHVCGTSQFFFLGVIPVGTSSWIPEVRKADVDDKTDLTFLDDSAYVASNRSDD